MRRAYEMPFGARWGESATRFRLWAPDRDEVALVLGPAGARRIPIGEFFTGPGRTAMQRGEFLTSIHLPPPSGASRGVYNKLGRTKIGDISMVSVAVNCRQSTGGATWRIAIGAAGPTPLRALEAEASLAQDVSPEGIDRAAELASAAARPIDDIRGSAAYRRAMVRVLSRRGIESVLAALQPASRGGGFA